MGYKLAGYDMVGCCEIDPRVNAVYQKNLHPKYNFVMDVRDLTSQELPEEMFNLDILDGSPPCSVFSIAGNREEGWGTEKAFHEGQKMQRLDDLFFAFISVAEKLKPKVVVAENVKGLLIGNAKGYVHEIFKAFDSAGYDVQLFLLDAQYMGVPQRRERSVFIARRKDLAFPKIKMDFHEKQILFGEVRSKNGVPIRAGLMSELVKKRKRGDTSFANISMRERGKLSGFTDIICDDESVCATLTGAGIIVRFYDGKKFSDHDLKSVQTFPQDYDFGGQGVQGAQQAKYICGMSVPPVMMAQIARQIYLQWLKG